MKKTVCKRTLAMLLCALLLVGIVPFGAFAEENEGQQTSLTNDVAVSGAGLGNILSRAASNAEDEDPDYGIDKFYMVQDNIAYVQYHAKENCKIVLAVYAEDTVQMLASGMEDVDASETEVNIVIDIATMPEHYFLRAFMLDFDNAPLGAAQVNIESTTMFERFDSKTVDDYSDNVVINLDEQEDDNFAVLVDGATQMDYDNIHNVLESYDEETGKYVFSNIDDTIRNAAVGTILTFSVGETVYLLKIKSCAVYSGNRAELYEEKDTPIEELFEYIDIDIDSAETAEGITYDQSEANENFEIVGYEEWDEGNDYGLNQLSNQANESPRRNSQSKNAGPKKANIIDIDTNASISCPLFKTKDENGYLVGNKDSHFSIRGSADLKLSGQINLKCYYDTDWDVSWEWRWDVWNSLHIDIDNYFYFKLSIDLKLKGEVQFTIKAQGDLTITKLVYCVFGVMIEGGVKLHVEGSVSFGASIEIKWTVGFYYDTDSGWTNLSGAPKLNLLPKGALEATVTIAVQFEPEISLIKVIGVGLLTEVGFDIKVTLFEFDTQEVINLTSVDDIHACAAFTCFEGDVSIYLKVSVKGTIFNKTFGQTELKPKASLKLFDLYMRTSPSFEFHLTKCPNHAYRCDFTVVNSENKPIKNLDVQSNGPALDGYPFNVTNATDDNGQVSFFYPEGSYTPKFFLNGREMDVSKIRVSIFNQVVAGGTITMIDTTKAITVKIDTNETDGGGSGHNGGTGSTNWFNYTATFNANGGQFTDGSTSKELTVRGGAVITPPNDPTRSNYYFAGWDPDIPAKMPYKNTTFTATWSTTPTTGHADGIGSADDLSNGGTQGGIIQFGAYPQTKVTDSATISALNSRASGWQSYGYYSGSGSWADGQMTAKDYMQYCDVKYGGSKYRGVTFSQYRPYYTGYTSSASYTYQDDNGYTTGTTYWFKYEPLQWKVLDPSEGLVMCVSLIDSQPYNNYILSSGTDFHGNTAYWGDAGKTHYANDYANSSLHDWLNETFYATAFTEAQQNRILVNRNQNNDGYYTLTGNTNYTDYDSDPTNDKIFLLSYADVNNSAYGFSSSYSAYDTARQAKGTDYAKCQGLWVNSSGSYQGNSWWWLRSPGDYSSRACNVHNSGYASGSGTVDSTSYGIRPACKISNLASGISKSGNLSRKAAPTAKATAEGGAGIYQYSNTACVAGNDYILLNVTGYGSDFTLTTGNLEYIDQLTADETGKVSGTFLPRNAVSGSTTLLIGDFGSGTEARQLTVTEQTQPQEHTHTYTSTVTTPATCTTPGVRTYTCDCSDTYTESIPALGHVDEGNDGHCDRCGEQMQGDEYCPQCGKIHNGGFFDKIVGFFHRIIYRLTHLFKR